MYKYVVYIVLVQILIHLFTCHTTQALIKCPLFLSTFDLIYPTFIFLPVLCIFQKSWINGNEPMKFPPPPQNKYHMTKLFLTSKTNFRKIAYNLDFPMYY